jgi:hypothetical protein
VVNPYIRVHRQIRRNRGWRPSGLFVVLGAALSMALAGDKLLWFLPQTGPLPPTADLATGLSAVALRIAALVASAVLLHSYTDLVRGPDRAVLDVHPVRPVALVTAIAWRCAVSRFYLVIVGAVMLAPVAWRGNVPAFLGGLALVFSAWLGALGVGFAVHLGGVWAASSPKMATLLNAIRGDNPPMQAALIYAPGVGLAIVGGGLVFASIGLEAAMRGWSWGWTWLAIPPVIGAAAWSQVPRLAAKHYVRASLILAEVEGQWASRDQPIESHHVYMERLGQGRPDVLRALRQGWRNLRLFGTSAWVIGCICALMVWTDTALDRWLWLSGAGVLFIATIGARLAEGDPEWLNQSLGVKSSQVGRARMLVAWVYAQGVAIPMCAVALISHGTAAGPAVLSLCGLTIIGAALAALTGIQWRERALWAYGPTGLVLWALFLRITT